MASDGFYAVWSCWNCIRIQGRTFKEQKLMKRFSAAVSLRICRDGRTRPVEEVRAGNYLHPRPNRPLYQKKVYPALKFHVSYSGPRISEVLFLRVRRLPVHSNRRRKTVHDEVL